MVGSEVFVDSSFWIAAVRQRDAQHERAKVLGTEMVGRRAVAVISDMVLAEVVTFILKKDGHEAARELMDRLVGNSTVLFVDKSLLSDAMALLRTYWSPRKKLSVCDATSYTLMQHAEIDLLYSFDSGFDGLPGITRIC